MQAQTEDPRVQWMIYDQVSHVVDTLLQGFERKVSVGPSTRELPDGDEFIGYDVRVSWIADGQRWGIIQPLLMMDLDGRLPRKEVIEAWACHYFGAEIGLWRARRDGVIPDVV